MYFVGVSEEIQYDETRRLSDCRIVNLSNIAVVTLLDDGCDYLDELCELPGFITVTTTEPCMYSLDDDPTCKRAKMPCGHVIGTVAIIYFRSKIRGRLSKRHSDGKIFLFHIQLCSHFGRLMLFVDNRLKVIA